MASQNNSLRRPSSQPPGSPRRQARLAGCWIDLFQGPDFSGSMRRVLGPRTFRVIAGECRGEHAFGSVIVGPTAQLLLVGSPDSKEPAVRVSPGKLVPDVRALSARGVSQLQIFHCRRPGV